MIWTAADVTFLSRPLRNVLLAITATLPLHGTSGQELVTDLNPIQFQQSTTFGDFGTSGGLTFFGTLAPGGHKLHVTDGTASGTRLVKHIREEREGHGPRDFIDLDGNGTVLFRANDGLHGEELWLSDGTEAGTRMLLDIRPGPSGSNPVEFFKLGNEVFFAADDGVHGNELWKSDGTAQGTTLAMDFWPGPLGAFYRGPVAVLGNRAVLALADAAHGLEPHITDGTAAGTTLLADITPGPVSSLSLVFATVGNQVFLSVSPSTRLWATDGTPAGTRQVASLSQLGGVTPFAIVPLGNLAIILTISGIFRSDGTPQGTYVIRAGNPFSIPSVPTLFQGRLYFLARETPPSLWVTDGSLAGTHVVLPGRTPPGRPEASLIATNQTLLYRGVDATLGAEPWRTDGTLPGTQLVVDLHSGATGSSPTFEHVDGNLAYFSADDGNHGRELWVTDGTAGGTLLLRDIHGPEGQGSIPLEFVELDGMAYFSADLPDVGRELVRSDGTAAGTVLVKDLKPGPTWGEPQFLTVMNGVLYFHAHGPSNETYLWRSDGTSAGTQPVATVDITGPMVVYQNHLYFPGAPWTQRINVELWRSDGTPGGTGPFYEVAGIQGYYPQELTVADGKLYFSAFDHRGHELHVSDGTQAGTALLLDVYPGPLSGDPKSLIALETGIVFTAETPAFGREPWTSDGTLAGTTMLRDIHAGPNGSDILSFRSWRHDVYFAADDRVHGSELWKSDGSPTGTVLVHDFVPGLPSSRLQVLQAAENLVYVQVLQAGPWRGLWRTDGSQGGTRFLRDVFPGQPAGLTRASLVAGSGDHLLFDGGDGDRGDELWVSDGTSGGTLALRDVMGEPLYVPREFSRVGRTVYMAASQRAFGREPFVVDLGALGATLAARFSKGCAGTAGQVPDLRVNRPPRLGDRTHGFEVRFGRPQTAAALVLGTQRASWPIAPGCVAAIGGTLQIAGSQTNAIGEARWLAPIPMDPALLGAELRAQSLLLDPEGALNLISFSQGLHLVIGR